MINHLNQIAHVDTVENDEYNNIERTIHKYTEVAPS